MAPLTALLKGGPKKLSWNINAEEGFERLKDAFTTAPVLKHPDPSRQFTVEVDASNVGVGVNLSQWVENKPKLHPVAFFTHKLSPTERNYDVGNRELLAIKLALVEWRHWRQSHLGVLTSGQRPCQASEPRGRMLSTCLLCQ